MAVRKKALKPAVSATNRSLSVIAREPSTIAGIITIASALAIGPISLTSASLWSAIGTGLSLIFVREAPKDQLT